MTFTYYVNDIYLLFIANNVTFKNFYTVSFWEIANESKTIQCCLEHFFIQDHTIFFSHLL